MALRWENPASTTHSLTPSPSNRPLIFWILTPCEKPVATGSAGRCEPGVGRFTDPHPLTCSFFTPPFYGSMFGLCSLSTALSKPVFLVEENSLFQRGQSHASMRCPCRPGRACFFLSAFSVARPSHLSLLRGWAGFFSSRFAAVPEFVHNCPTQLQQGGEPVSLVSFPYPAHKTAHRPSQGRVWFSPSFSGTLWIWQG